jgi:type II secretory ATPase GspE/PulE/Tfp pilus assembly ATPase PilB-like protein
LKKAFIKHIEYICASKDCPDEYRDMPEINFETCQRTLVRNYVSGIFSSEGGRGLGSGEGEEEKKENDEAAAVILLDSILSEARERRASDIHIEKGLVRFRVDGALETYISLQNEKAHELVQRIKLLAGMNVIEKRRCQNGHFVYGNSSPIFLRVSSIPLYDAKNLFEESLVLRLLDTSRLPLEMNYLGFSDSQLDLIGKFELLKNGLVLVCGPTGSGKSTTLASILTDIVKKSFGEKKIISLEDPPEYVIPDVCQIQVSYELKNSFKDALVHIFRQDPDVIMIGEIRDEMSAEAALRAAMTGHLVFATLHTSSAVEALLRLENLGCDRRILASVIKGVICQELEFMEDDCQLFADVAVPQGELAFGAGASLGVGELDNQFIHINNYNAGFSKSIQVMGRRHKAGLPFIRVWNGGENEKNADRCLG